jgi:hypothetical protein
VDYFIETCADHPRLPALATDRPPSALIEPQEHVLESITDLRGGLVTRYKSTWPTARVDIFNRLAHRNSDSSMPRINSGDDDEEYPVSISTLILVPTGLGPANRRRGARGQARSPL